jgi:hypothetical protein
VTHCLAGWRDKPPELARQSNDFLACVLTRLLVRYDELAVLLDRGVAPGGAAAAALGRPGPRPQGFGAPVTTGSIEDADV